jgi:hypothetical protein
MHGPWVAVAAYLIWHQRKDYRSVCKRLNGVEDYCKETLADLVKSATKTIQHNTEIIEKWKRPTE